MNKATTFYTGIVYILLNQSKYSQELSLNLEKGSFQLRWYVQKQR